MSYVYMCVQRRSRLGAAVYIAAPERCTWTEKLMWVLYSRLHANIAVEYSPTVSGECIDWISDSLRSTSI